MLFLVPSNKDDDGSGKATAPTRGRVLVVLPPDTDLSSNVIVPDTAITNTLITNDALDPDDLISPNQLSLTKLSYMEPMQTRDHLGIIQPPGPESIYQHTHLQYEQIPTITTQPNAHTRREDTNHRRSFQYPSAEDTISRSRRHSHSGLVEMDHPILQALARSRSKSRSTFSQATPYQHQRTPRALRAALKKGRKDQSPLLTSASFGTDYGQPCFDEENEDPFGEWRVQQHHHNAIQQALGNHSPEMHFGSSFGQASSESERSSDSLNIKATGAAPSTRPWSSMGGGIEIDEEDKDRGHSHSKLMSNAPNTRRQLHDSQEDIDIMGVSDEEMEPLKAQTSVANQGSLIKPGLGPWRTPSLSPPEGKNKVPDEPNTYDADMDLILGMASDMDLVMPQFDDKYLDDLKNDPNLAIQSRRVPSVSAQSPATSHSSSTTITCISSLRSPQSRSTTPSLSVESAPRQESPPTSPATIEARKCSSSFSVKGQLPMMGNMSSPRSTENAQAGQDLSTIHRDIDNLKRHRDSLQNNIEMNASSSKGLPTPSSSSSSSSSSSNTPSQEPSSDKRSNPQAPLYFKPTHHTQPYGDHSHQNAMIIQSNQWTVDNAQSRPGPVGRPPKQPPNHAIRGNDGNHIFAVRESSPPSLPPVLDKSAIMTTNNISLATANMNVLTPREVQEDYYVKRNIQRMYQRNRRRSSTSAASSASAAAAAAAATVAMPPFRPIGAHVPHLSLSSTIPLPLRRASISPDGPHPLDKFGASATLSTMVPLMGVNPLPASYYIPPSAFRTEAAVAAEKEAERKRREEEELKDSFLVFPSPTLL